MYIENLTSYFREQKNLIVYVNFQCTLNKNIAQNWNQRLGAFKFSFMSTNCTFKTHKKMGNLRSRIVLLFRVKDLEHYKNLSGQSSSSNKFLRKSDKDLISSELPERRRTMYWRPGMDISATTTCSCIRLQGGSKRVEYVHSFKFESCCAKGSAWPGA